jgi:hypothetical protein
MALLSARFSHISTLVQSKRLEPIETLLILCGFITTGSLTLFHHGRLSRSGRRLFRHVGAGVETQSYSLVYFRLYFSV